MKIVVVGMGYVGCANALLLSQNHEVIIVDVDLKKVQSFNEGNLPIKDSIADDFFSNNELNLSASHNLESSITGAEYVILALPTNFNEKTNLYDTSAIEEVVSQIIASRNHPTIIIKSTINIGFTNKIRKKFSSQNIIFSPEFLREGFALHDNLNPSRIIVGDINSNAQKFADLLAEGALMKNPQILLMSPEAAECVKLFSNTYLAMRVAFFNELDSYCFENEISTESVINGVSLDPRIGNYYNNPSFGYGGYCLPKDSKQLLSAFEEVPQKLIDAIVESNKSRKNFLSSKILDLKPKVVGIYSLSMKKDSDNARESAVIDILDDLLQSNIEIIIFEPHHQHQDSYNYIENFEEFAEKADLIIANRISDELTPYKAKVFTRDIFNQD